MGCDIHVHIEIKVDDRWLHYATPQVKGGYDLFAIMGRCGRRSEITPIVENRGLPSDISEVTRICEDRWGTDGHGHSYLMASELQDLRDRWESHAETVYKPWLEESGKRYSLLDYDLEHSVFRTYLFGNSLNRVPCGPVQDLRIVFWFDN